MFTDDRGSGKINTLAVIQGNTPPVDFAPVTVDTLTSSVLVAGAVLFGTGDCSINNDIIHVSTSIQTPAVGTQG